MHKCVGFLEGKSFRTKPVKRPQKDYVWISFEYRRQIDVIDDKKWH